MVPDKIVSALQRETEYYKNVYTYAKIQGGKSQKHKHRAIYRGISAYKLAALGFASGKETKT